MVCAEIETQSRERATSVGIQPTTPLEMSPAQLSIIIMHNYTSSPDIICALLFIFILMIVASLHVNVFKESSLSFS